MYYHYCTRIVRTAVPSKPFRLYVAYRSTFLACNWLRHNCMAVRHGQRGTCIKLIRQPAQLSLLTLIHCIVAARRQRADTPAWRP